MNTARRAVYISENLCEGLVETISKLKGETLAEGEFYKNTIKLYPAHSEEYALNCIEECRCLFRLPVNEIEPAFMLIFAVLRRSQSPVLQKVAEIMVNIFLEDTENMAYVKIRVLSNFYNLMPSDAPVRRTLFMAVLKLVADNNELKSITTQLQNIDALLDSWKTSIDEKRSTYLTISDILYKDPEYKHESYEFKLKYLLTFEDVTNEKVLEQTLPRSEAAIISAVSTKGIFTFDRVRDMNATKRLFCVEPSYQELVSYFISGKLHEYQKFCENNASFFKSKNFDFDVALEKMKLIALCKVFEKNLNTDVHFKTLADAADIPLSDVEDWMIRLLQADLCTVSINQVSQTVTATRCLFTEFNEEQWLLIKEKLIAWEETTNNILNNLKISKSGTAIGYPQKTTSPHD